MNTIAKHLANIKNSGMSHLKFELEAQLNRQNRSVTWDCERCAGRSTAACVACMGTGAVLQRNLLDPNAHVECRACNGNGGAPCDACDGRGLRGDFGNTTTCMAYMMDGIAQEVYGKSITELAREGKHLGDMDSNGGQAGGTALPFINYARFYYDGSVDSEFTVTTPVEHGDKAVTIIKVFKKLSHLASRGDVDVRGSGMHIAVLPEGCNGRYPVSSIRLNPAGLSNFTKEVTKLLPALYFVGTAGHRSRSMQYRTPRISNNSKYSAIYTRERTIFEFRVFETCYDRPEAVLEYIQVISNALKFYADPTRKVKTLGKQFGFPSTNEIAHYYGTSEQLRILNSSIKYLKPEDKSFKQMKLERGLKYTIKSLAVKEKSRLAQLRAEYQEYKKHWDYLNSRPLSKYEKEQIDWMMIEESYTLEVAEQRVRKARQNRLVPFSEFLQQNLTKQRLSNMVAV